MADYDKLAKAYFEKRQNNLFDYNKHIEIPAIINIIGDVKNKVILDMGCGFGDHAAILSKKKFKKLLGFDLSKELIKYANQRKISNAEFSVGDMSKKLNYENSYFDIVYAGLSIHYVKNQNKLFNEVNRVLKKGGIFVFSTGHPVFNMINNSTEHKIAIQKTAEGKINILGDYFDESEKENDLGRKIGKVRFCSFTFETLIKAGLKNGFELIDYADAKPVSSSKNLNPEKYRLTTTLPTFIIFKFRKK